jgi:hypothetical protein
LYLPYTIDAAAEETFRKKRIREFITAIAKSILAPDGSALLHTNIIVFSSWPEDWQNLLIEELKPLKKINNEYYKKLVALKEVPF